MTPPLPTLPRRILAIKCLRMLSAAASYNDACETKRALYPEADPFRKLHEESVGAFQQRLIAHVRDLALDWLGHNIALK